MQSLPLVRLAVLLFGPIALFVPLYLVTLPDLGKQEAGSFAGGVAATLGIVPGVAWDAAPWFRNWIVGVYLAMLALAVAVLVGKRYGPRFVAALE